MIYNSLDSEIILYHKATQMNVKTISMVKEVEVVGVEVEKVVVVVQGV